MGEGHGWGWLVGGVAESCRIFSKPSVAIRSRGNASLLHARRALLARRRLHLLRHVPWRKASEAEVLTFPVGKHDYQVDAAGLVGQLLDKTVRGIARKPEAKASRDS